MNIIQVGGTGGVDHAQLPHLLALLDAERHARAYKDLLRLRAEDERFRYARKDMIDSLDDVSRTGFRGTNNLDLIGG